MSGKRPLRSSSAIESKSNQDAIGPSKFSSVVLIFSIRWTRLLVNTERKDPSITSLASFAIVASVETSVYIPSSQRPTNKARSMASLFDDISGDREEGNGAGAGREGRRNKENKESGCSRIRQNKVVKNS